MENYKRENKEWKVFIGNLVLDTKEVLSKPLLWKLVLGSISAFLLAEFFKGRNTRIHFLKDITESFIFANYKLKARAKSYTNGILALELYPGGIFSKLIRSKPSTFEAKLAYCHNITESGNKCIENILRKKSELKFRVDSVTGSTVYGWLFYGTIRKVNLNERLLRNGQCELLTDNLEELSEEKLRMIDEMRLNETYAKLTGRGRWEEYYKNSAKVGRLGSWFHYKLQQSIMRNKRWIKRILS